MKKLPKTKQINVISNTNYKPSGSYNTSASQKMSTFAKKFFDSTQLVVITLGIFVLIYLFVASFSIVDGPSMLPNFESGDLTLYEKASVSLNLLKRGDVVVFQAPTGKDFIKRVIGLPGEGVKVQGGKVYINNKPLNEPYLSAENQYVYSGSVFTEGLTITASPTQYILFGDNRKVSLDSRNLGPIEKDKIKGKVALVFWPLDKFHLMPTIDYNAKN